MSPTLARTLSTEVKSQQLEMYDIVQAASKVIVPLNPLTAFAARNPWSGLEQQCFEHTARWLKDICDVDIYPNDFIIKSAWKRGEINQDFLELSLKHWLDSQKLGIPRDEAELFCRAALMYEEPATKLVESPEIKSLADKLTFHFTEKHSIQTYSQRLEQLGKAKTANELNRHLIKWCKLFLDESQAIWSMPNRDAGFYQSWRNLIGYDPALKAAIRKQLKDLPQDAGEALMKALLELEIPYSQIQNYLEAHLLSLPGWAGMMLWRSEQTAQTSSLLMEYLAVRVSLEATLVKPYLPLEEVQTVEKVCLEPLIASWVHWGDIPIRKLEQLSNAELKARLTLAHRFDRLLRHRLWLEAWEKTYEDHLKKLITSKLLPAKENKTKPLAQFVFCIDVRSEPFRRKLEQAGPFETLGAAGFYGLPIETNELGSCHCHTSLPVMFKPQYRIKETAPEFELKQYEQRSHAANSLGSTFHMMKHNLLASLILPEISGPWLGLGTLVRSFVPRRAGSAFRKLKEAWLRKPETGLSLEHKHVPESDLPIGFTDDEKVFYAKQALITMGLTDHFAPLVVFCGHGSKSTNNPYASALDCGACGGASSGFNARVLAALCNLPKVRLALAKEGINIPEATVFTAAEHITTLDELHWLYVPELSNEAKEAFNGVQTILTNVTIEANKERIPKLPAIHTMYKNPTSEAERFANDWSEIRPEWGLVRNATLIIGKRELTQNCNLEGRAFLHNYDWKKDQDGTLLENIINGPGTVCQWINLQYYASTVAPHFYGSGNKVTQTVTSGIGVMQGNSSDLLSGLPWQSVMKSDQEAYHAPIRLLVVLQAPKQYVERLLEHNPSFSQKVQNGWIRLASIDPEGDWKSWT